MYATPATRLGSIASADVVGIASFSPDLPIRAGSTADIGITVAMGVDEYASAFVTAVSASVSASNTARDWLSDADVSSAVL